MAHITQEELKRILIYSKSTGRFFWIVKPSRRVAEGSEAGSTRNKKGYRSIKIAGRQYLAHRLAWLYVTGSWPKDMLDHKDRDTSNNKWSNLREVDRSQNCWNRRVSCNNSTGVTGVSFYPKKKKFRVSCSIRGVRKNMGYFSTLQQAKTAYQRCVEVYRR